MGSGILGRSLIYTLAKEQKQFEKITLFCSNSFAWPCTLHSTAIVAPRGLTAGHSALGDLLLESFKVFAAHVELDRPCGVEKIKQFTGATQKLAEFKTRYPHGHLIKDFLCDETYVAIDEAYLIDPKIYCDWLLDEAKSMDHFLIEEIHDFVTEVNELEKVHVKTQNGQHLTFDKVIFTAGSFNRFWKDLAPNSKLNTSKPSQGSYIEFNDVDWSLDSFSLTLDGDNLIWNKALRRLLIGSTTLETHHVLPPTASLEAIHHRLKNALALKIPDGGEIKVGLREKAQKRGPYIIAEGKIAWAGGLYKNGFSLSLKIAETLSRQNL